ncbi:MAG: tetratricopeptide repeat protein, partial [Gemmataceae bacterium]
MTPHPRRVGAADLLSGRIRLARRCVRQLERANRAFHRATDGAGARAAIERLEEVWPDLRECGKWLADQAGRPGPDPTVLALCKDYAICGYQVLVAYLPPAVMFEWAKPLLERAGPVLAGGPAEDRLLCGVPPFYLAKIHQALGLFADAEKWFRVSLQANVGEHGADHPYVGQVLDDLAVILQELHRPAEAEESLRRALALIERGFGPNHIEVVNPLNGLGYLLMSAGRSAEAEPLLRRAVRIEEAHGADRPTLAPVLNNLALLLWQTGRLGQAERTLRRSIDIARGGLGPEHPDVASSLGNLGCLLQESNRFVEAEELLRRAIEIGERDLGLDSVVMANKIEALARV